MKEKEMLPKPKPVEEIDISEKHTKLKIFIVIVAVIVALVSFGIGITTCLSEKKGWKTLTVETVAESCAGDFVCYYYLDKSGTGGRKHLNSVKDDYAEACYYAYRIFNATTEFEGFTNLATLNKNVNTEVRVDSNLYSAFTLMGESGSRALYLAPVYSYYYDLFFAYDETSAALNDPNKNADVAEAFTKILSYANSDEHINLELFGENKVRLNVSAEYKSFIESEYFGVYLDFFILKNAFIIDYISDFMTERDHGVLLSSFDGYMRSSLNDDKTYSLNVFDLDGNYENLAARVTGSGKISAARFKDYTTSKAQYDYFYTYSDGATVTPYLSENGLNSSCIHDLVTYSYTLSCAEVMLKSLPVYTAEEFSEESISDLKAAKIYSMYCESFEVIYNDPSIEDGIELVTSKEYEYKKRYID